MSDREPVFIAGLDLGRPHEFTALSVLERTEVQDSNEPTRTVRYYAVRHLERLPPATPYAEVFKRLAEVFAEPPLYGSKLVVDYTGVGWPVLKMLRKAKVGAKIVPLIVTAGNCHNFDERGSWCVPRQELAATVQVLLQSRHLQMAPTLPQTATLVRELTAFQLKATATTKQELDVWRQGRHDDLVLAVAVAAWLGENAMHRMVVWV